jgi:acetoin utilization protein AcuB
MFVRHRMSAKVTTIGPGHSITTARKLLQQENIHHLPVVAKGKLVGIVTDRDLRSAPSTASTVESIMQRDVITIPVESYMDHAAQLMRRHRIGALPVIEKNRLVGILTASDVLDAFVAVAGLSRPTYSVVLNGVRSPSAVKRVRDIVHQHRSEVMWLHRDRSDPSRIHLRLKTSCMDELTDAFEAADFPVVSIVSTATR